MSRSGYCEDGDYSELYRANVERSLAGKKGQNFLRELSDAMDAMPDKRLIANELVNAQGECCTMGVLCKTRQLDVSKIYYEDPDIVGKFLGISAIMAAEISFMNDEYLNFGNWSDVGKEESPEQRWIRMRKWVSEQLK